MTTTTSKFDVGKYLVDDATIETYLDDCFEEGGSQLFVKALGEVARARGMTEVAETAGLTRASLYKSLGEGGNPALSTIEKVIDILGFRLAVVRKQEAAGTGVKATRRAMDIVKYEFDAKPAAKPAAQSRVHGVVEKTPAYAFAAARRNGTHDTPTMATGRFVSHHAAAKPRATVKDATPPAKKKKSPR